MAEELARRSPERSVEVVIEGTPAVRADPRLMRAVLENLFANAWKFTAKVRAPRVGFAALSGEGGTAFVVRDNGAGFDMRHAARLFQPFHRLHRESDFPGTGIGLAVCRKIVERHGGRIWVQPAAGGGSAFRFTLPARGL